MLQRTSSDLRANPQLVLERLVRRIERHLRRCGRLGTFGHEAEPDGEGDAECHLAASAVSGQMPPAGPQ